MSNYNCEDCKDTGELKDGNACQKCCGHQWDFEEGGMCVGCGREDYYNFMPEDDK